jgi:hypothetical protein
VIELGIERGEPQLSIYSMKKSFTLQPRDLCRLKKLVDDPRRSIACTEVEKTQFQRNYKILKNIGTELKIGTDGDENLFINFKWPKIDFGRIKTCLQIFKFAGLIFAITTLPRK